MVDDAFHRDLTAKSTNWCVNNVMEWWSINERNLIKVHMALKYLAVPASSTPFSQLKLILDRKRYKNFSASPNFHPFLLDSLQAVSIM